MSRRVRRLLAIAAAYVACWMLTIVVGPPAIEPLIKGRMEQRWGGPLPLAASVFEGRAHYPYFAIRTLSPMPFVLFSEYGSGTSPQSDEGGHSWYVWLGPFAWPIRTTVTGRQ